MDRDGVLYPYATMSLHKAIPIWRKKLESALH